MHQYIKYNFKDNAACRVALFKNSSAAFPTAKQHFPFSDRLQRTLLRMGSRHAYTHYTYDIQIQIQVLTR